MRAEVHEVGIHIYNLYSSCRHPHLLSERGVNVHESRSSLVSPLRHKPHHVLCVLLKILVLQEDAHAAGQRTHLKLGRNWGRQRHKLEGIDMSDRHKLPSCNMGGHPWRVEPFRQYMLCIKPEKQATTTLVFLVWL